MEKEKKPEKKGKNKKERVVVIPQVQEKLHPETLVKLPDQKTIKTLHLVHSVTEYISELSTGKKPSSFVKTPYEKIQQALEEAEQFYIRKFQYDFERARELMSKLLSSRVDSSIEYVLDLANHY